MSRKGLLEKISQVFHDSWTHWSKAVAPDIKNQERLARWEKSWVPYDQLGESTKDLDREWAEKVMEIIEPHLASEDSGPEQTESKYPALSKVLSAKDPNTRYIIKITEEFHYEKGTSNFRPVTQELYFKKNSHRNFNRRHAEVTKDIEEAMVFRTLGEATRALKNEVFTRSFKGEVITVTRKVAYYFDIEMRFVQGEGDLICNVWETSYTGSTLPEGYFATKEETRAAAVKELEELAKDAKWKAQQVAQDKWDTDHTGKS